MNFVCIGCGSELLTNSHRDQLCQECYEDQYLPSVKIKIKDTKRIPKQRNERNYEARTRERKKRINRSTDKYISLI